MTGVGLADKIRSDMGFPIPVSTELTGWGSGIVTHIKLGSLVAHASGTVSGTAPPAGGPLSSGIATGTPGANISSMSGATMAGLVQIGAGYPSVSSELSTFCDEIVSHIQTLGQVDFASGEITGTCTNTVLSPGPLTGGAGTGGIVSGLNGDTLATAIHNAVGYPGAVSTPLKLFCNAITDYIEANASVAYASGAVTVTCPIGGGGLINGAGAGGLIS